MKDNTINNPVLFNYIPKIITDVDNERLNANPTMNELKGVVLSMDAKSAPGPDGIYGKFYHVCWNIIKNDLLLMILDFFFVGNQIPRELSHTCLILLPKVDFPQSFTELRHISLSNFSFKIISKLVNQRLSPLMHKLISPNQTGFIKGRSLLKIF